MPLTAKGSEIKKNLVKEYGEKKGTSVLYAGKNSGDVYRDRFRLRYRRIHGCRSSWRFGRYG